MKEELTINGRLFVSSSFGSELVDYTSDYIGQLARDGKVTSEKIGRTLYVDQYELLQYAQEKNNAGDKRGPKKKKTGGSKKKDIAITIPNEEDVRNSVPLSYQKDDDSPTVLSRKNSSVKPKNKSLKGGNLNRKSSEKTVTTLKEDKPVVGREAVDNIKVNKKGSGFRRESSLITKVSVSILAICTLTLLSGVFMEYRVAYEENTLGIDQTSSSFGFQAETFFTGLKYFQNKVGE